MTILKDVHGKILHEWESNRRFYVGDKLPNLSPNIVYKIVEVRDELEEIYIVETERQ